MAIFTDVFKSNFLCGLCNFIGLNISFVVFTQCTVPTHTIMVQTRLRFDAVWYCSVHIHTQIAMNPTEPVRRVYDDVNNIDSGDSDDLPAFSSVRSRAKRFRSKFMPPIPRRISDVTVQGEWSKTWKDRHFLSCLDNNMGFAVFTTRKFLSALQEADFLYIDGTFRSAPSPFKQFVTIHGYLKGFVVPLVFVLMSGKMSVQYRRVLQHVKQRVFQKTGRHLAPNQIICDFEKSLHVAIQFEFPQARTVSCYYHFCQSLWRRVEQVGLARSYNRDPRLKKVIRRVTAIAYVPTLLVLQNFHLYCASRRVTRLIAQYQQLQQWLDYCERIYVSRHAIFPPMIWNVYDRCSDMRTNNHLEGENLL